MRQPASCKKTNAEQSGLRILRNGSIEEHYLIRVLPEDRLRSRRGKEEREPTTTDQSHRSKRNEQKQPQAAADTAAEMHHCCQKQDVSAYLRSELPGEIRSARQHSTKRHYTENDVADVAIKIGLTA